MTGDRTPTLDRAEFDRHIQIAREQLGEAAFEMLPAEGRALTLRAGDRVGAARARRVFGFRSMSASRYGIRCEWEVPDEAFMILELQRGALDSASGLAKYQPEWNGV